MMTPNSPAQLALSEDWELLRRPEDSRYPRVFGMSLLFIPGKNRMLNDTFGWGEHAGAFYDTGDFIIQRFGPGLSTYDEDTLISIIQICSARRLTGATGTKPSEYPGLPAKMPEASLLFPSGDLIFHVGQISPYRINKYFGREVSGNSLRLCYESIIRLSQTTLYIQRKGFPRVVDSKFFHAARERNYMNLSEVYIDPLMTAFLSEYVTIDLNIRRQLSPTGKAVYRYLESSGIETIPLSLLMEKIGTPMSIMDFKRLLIGRNASEKRKGTIGELEILKTLGWLRAYELGGNGRSQPFCLKIEKAKARKQLN